MDRLRYAYVWGDPVNSSDPTGLAADANAPTYYVSRTGSNITVAVIDSDGNLKVVASWNTEIPASAQLNKELRAQQPNAIALHNDQQKAEQDTKRESTVNMAAVAPNLGPLPFQKETREAQQYWAAQYVNGASSPGWKALSMGGLIASSVYDVNELNLVGLLLGVVKSGTPAPRTAPTETPGFVGTPQGELIPVPSGAKGPVPVVNPQGRTTGFGYTGGSGGPGLDPRVSDVRIMEPTPPRGASPGYPGGYVNYRNATNQSVNPWTGQTIQPSDPAWHIPLKTP